MEKEAEQTKELKSSKELRQKWLQYLAVSSIVSTIKKD